MRELGLQITKARVDKKITQNELADAMEGKVTIQELIAAENGNQSIRLGQLVDIAKALDMRVEIDFQKLRPKGDRVNG